MKMYVVYDQKSGKIVHTHSTLEEGRLETDRILRLVHPAQDRTHLATLEVGEGELAAGESYHVNPATKKLEKTKKGAGSTGGAKRFRGR